jgi:sugar (pentulose or hexulose) kinase
MQHGTVFWSRDGEALLEGLDAGKTLLEQLEGDGGKSAFSHPFSPNWQDASTQVQCEAFDGRLGSQERLAEVTGSKAHHVRVHLFSFGYTNRFHSGSVVLRFYDFVKSIRLLTWLRLGYP